MEINKTLFNYIVARNIERIIENKRITKNDIGELGGLNSEKTDLLFNGKIDWDLNFILKICKKLVVDIEEIIPKQVLNNVEDKNISDKRGTYSTN